MGLFDRVRVAYIVQRGLRGDGALVTAFSRSIAGFSNGSGKPEIKYDSTDTDIRDAVSFVWDFLAGVRLPTT